MNKIFDEILCEKFPLLYRDRHADMQQTAMCWGFDCGSGWFQIIFNLSKELELLIAALPPTCSWCGDGPHEPRDLHFHETTGATIDDIFTDERPRAIQVKEKFGGLRFYMSSQTKAMDDLIDEAEKLSYETCESCGAPSARGAVGSSPFRWIRTLCDKCHEDRNKK